MTRSSQPVREHILEFDNDLERTLKRKRKQLEFNPPSSSSEFEFEVETETESEEEQDMAVDNRTIKELSASELDNVVPLCIQYLKAVQGKTDEFELKSSLLHHFPKYHELSMEDPNKHLKEFEVVCSSMTPINVDGNILKMKAFPFSLMEKAKDWLFELALGTVTSWESMKKTFLEKFLPTSRVLSRRILSSRQMLNASAGGALVDKTPVAMKILIMNRALNAQQYEGVGGRDHKWQSQVNEVVEGSNVQGTTTCGVCSMQGHLTDQCPQLIESGGWESANAVGYQGQNQPRWQNSSDNLENKANYLVQPLSIQIEVLETAKAITLRSGKEIGTNPKKSKHSQKEDKQLLLEKEEVDKATTREEQPLPQLPKAPIPPNLGKVGSNSIYSKTIPPIVPFPRMFIQSKKEENEKDILETFRKLQVNIPFLDAIKQVPKYAKFLKELCATRRWISNKEMVQVSKNVSAVLQRKLPPKCKDLGELKNDGVIIQLADRSNAYPKGVLEDVLEQAPILELKQLPNHLKYVFLGDKETLLVIVFSTLTALEEEKMVWVLKEHKTAIGWTLANIKGISPTTCMHRILLEEGAKPT
ncbi:uncharacterized protein [Malus domestica]|uniref:uncharacterized protein n=1 Tax=Malus domestica TaxID=3750 RepID=UPI0039771F50